MAAPSDLANLFQADGDGVRFRVRVTPRAAKNAICGVVDTVLRVRIAAPPVEGRANEALLRYLSEVFRVPVRRLTILYGEGGREKTIRIAGLRPEEALEAVARVLPAKS
ncbi:hypothetical protein EDD75_2105 [Thermodesulfitimonas autotrophica]|uniref:UPF0235 protein EDD75_2105 n=1 Tax=Thermodesulfitimonas autotrophica TaxID=1894989 RepID=A0A3N5AEB1_9THEO|nr:DUF167 domain-containing protein [Thermodesulfitimonas autotrophica]RPF42987.1 hypothetical protein EDD75_2105 [Thermodesulfitimonas autotrophica]